MKWVEAKGALTPPSISYTTDQNGLNGKGQKLKEGKLGELSAHIRMEA
jgi:hypothetical protein